MQLRSEQLATHLERGPLARRYVVAADEALLGLEAQDAIRAKARSLGYEERQVLHVDARTDWSTLTQAANDRSLFSARRLLEVRLPTGKPGKAGAAALLAHARRDDPDTLTILSLPRLDRAARAADWALAWQSAAAWIDIAPINREQLPGWLAARLARQQQSAPRAALEYLADQVEGNLLAAHQELLKLRLLHEAGPLDLEQIRAALFDVARFEGVSLPAALLSGDRQRIMRTLAGLRAEGEPLPLLLWMVAEELRNLLRLQAALAAGRPFAAAVRGLRLAAPAAAVERVARRTHPDLLADLLARCAQLDRLVKGIPVARRGDDPWLELMTLGMALAPPAAVSADMGKAERRPLPARPAAAS